MKINHNISAIITNLQLLRTEDRLSNTMERLSSGFKINHASDDPSGMAISGKMHTQIKGLNRASQNAGDGINVIQTADGSLSEVTNMLQRMRELSVQAANELNSQSELKDIQKEIDSLRSEINRVSDNTEFNTKSLLDGSLDTRVYGEHFSRMYVSDTVTPGNYKINIKKESTQAEIQGTKVLTGTITKEQAGAIKINNVGIKITEGMTEQDVYGAIRRGAEQAGAKVSDPKEKFSITSDFYGMGSELEITVSNDKLKEYLGLNNLTEKAKGKDAEVELTRESSTGTKVNVGFSKQATLQQEGNRFIITDTEGFTMDFSVENEKGGFQKGEIKMEVTDIGPMVLHIGANADQNMRVRVPSISSENLYLDDIDVTKSGGADRSMRILDRAIARVSDIRAGMGAAQNRLESTVSFLDETDENMNASVSRIEDADMAAEMTEYTRYTVLQQAATSVLSQANEIPQMALQLLQK